MKGIMRWLTLEGLNLERLIRKIGEAGIPLVQMRRTGRKVSVLLPEDRISEAVAMAEQGGWSWRAGQRSGLMARVVEGLKHRWVLLFITIAGLFCITLTLQLMWSVEIVGAGGYQADVQAFLQEQDIKPPVWKHCIDLAALRRQLEWRYPKVAWVDCGWRGTSLMISFTQGTPLGNTASHTGKGHVVALRSGIVESIITASGTPQVQPGDVITKGQILIEGWEQGENQEKVPVKAQGKVLARVWDAASVQVRCTETQTHYTGRQQESRFVRCPWFPLMQGAASPYEQQDVQRTVMPLGGMFFPFVLEIETRYEAEFSKTKRDMEAVQAEACEAALRKLREKIDFHDELVDKWVDYCMIENEVLEAVAFGERILDVAQMENAF